jgi:hypothetical protein
MADISLRDPRTYPAGAAVDRLPKGSIIVTVIMVAARYRFSISTLG